MIDRPPIGSIRPADALGATAAAIGLQGAVRELYRALDPEPTAPPALAALAAHALMVGVAVAAGYSRPTTGLHAEVRVDAPGSRIARRVLPAMIAVPIGLGAIRLYGERVGLYDAESGVALMVVATILMLGVVVGAAARAANREDGARRRAEDEARLWATVVERAGWGIVIGSADGTTLERMNPAFAAMHGFTVEELTGRPILDVFAPEVRDEIPARLERCHREGHHTFESLHVRRDGSTFPVLIDMTAVRDEHGRLRFRAVNVQDVSLLKETEAAMRRAKEIAEATSRELEAFSYSVSHDLRAPLRSMDGFGQALLEDYADRLDDTGRDYIARIRAASQRMGILIDALLDLSRVSRVALRRERVDLSALAREVAAGLRDRAPERAVTFAIAPDLVAEGDPRLVRVVLENLIGNAWKFTAGRPTARIEVGRAGDEFFVRDDGVGFDMAWAGKLFGAFQRLHGRHEFEGTGIGLATVQRIVHRHGGAVRAEAKVGEGAAFFFTLGAREVESDGS